MLASAVCNGRSSPHKSAVHERVVDMTKIGCVVLYVQLHRDIGQAVQECVMFMVSTYDRLP